MKILKQLCKTGLAALLISAFAVNSLSAKEQEVQTIELNTTKGMPVNITVTQNGFLFDKFKGKAVLLDFFGPHCPPCLLEIPHLIEMQEKHKDTLQIIGVQVQMKMTNEELNTFIKEKGINYPVVNLDYAWDLVSFVRANTGWKGQIPYMLIFDKEGNLKRQFIGMVENSEILKYAK